jgi:hypothetical protein
MIAKVTDRKLYHASAANTYKQALALNQTVRAGAEYNPFFQFYESVLEYPVTDGSDGATIQVNAVDWLHRVRAGTIQTSHTILAEKAFEVSQHYMMLCRELIMEQLRQEEFHGEPPSRQRCMFLSESAEEARSWIPLIGGNGVVCELICTGSILRADSRLMVKVSEQLSVTRDRGLAYWCGEASADPRMETLFEGTAVVAAIGL